MVRDASGPGDRGDIDDAAGLVLDEVGRDRLAHQEHGLDVDLEGLVPFRLGIPGERHARWQRRCRHCSRRCRSVQLRLDAVQGSPGCRPPGSRRSAGRWPRGRGPGPPGRRPGVRLLEVGDGDVRALLARQSAIPRPIPDRPRSPPPPSRLASWNHPSAPGARYDGVGLVSAPVLDPDAASGRHVRMMVHDCADRIQRARRTTQKLNNAGGDDGEHDVDDATDDVADGRGVHPPDHGR